MPAPVNKFNALSWAELAAFALGTAAAFAAVFPANTLTALVSSETNAQVTMKYLDSIIRINPDNKYKFLLADTAMAASRFSKAMITVNMIKPENSAVMFRKDLYTLAIMHERGISNETQRAELRALQESMKLRLYAEKDAALLATVYAQAMHIRAYFAAALAADILANKPGKDAFYWLSRAALATEKNGEPRKAAALYLRLAALSRDKWDRRMNFKKAFDLLSAAGEYREMKRALMSHATEFAGDRHTAATLLRFSRMTGDAALARDVALVILRSGGI